MSSKNKTQTYQVVRQEEEEEERFPALTPVPIEIGDVSATGLIARKDIDSIVICARSLVHSENKHETCKNKKMSERKTDKILRQKSVVPIETAARFYARISRNRFRNGQMVRIPHRKRRRSQNLAAVPVGLAQSFLHGRA